MAVTRRVKIVCTMGPATASPERMRGLVEAGMDVARLNFSHGSHEDHQQVYDLVRAAARGGRPRRRHPGRPAGPEDPARAGSPTARTTGRTGDVVTITSDDILGTPDRVSCTYTKLPAGGQGRRPAADRRRQGRRRGLRRRRQRHPLPGRRGRPGLQQQGRLAAQRRGQRPRDERQGRGGPALRARPRRRPDRAVVRPLARRHQARAPDHGRGGRDPSRSSPRWRSPRRSTTSRRSCWPSTASWWPAATSASSSRSTRCRWCRSAPCSSAGRTPSRSSSPPRCSTR